MDKSDHKKLIGFIFLGLLLANAKSITAQSAATNILPDFIDNNVTASISSSGNGSYHFGHTSNGGDNKNIHTTDRDTVRYLAMSDATSHLPSGPDSKNNASINPSSLEMDMELDPGTALNSIFNIHSILFNYQSSKLSETSKSVLDKVAYVIRKHPNAIFELGAHTDARGIYSDNMVLSKKRVLSALKYLMSKGVDKNQLVLVAYGETALKNVCDSDSHCSEEVHAGNRRLEVNVISINK